MSQFEHFVEQVDQELHEEKVRKYWEKNKQAIVATFLLFFAALFAYVGWQNYRVNYKNTASERFIAAVSSDEAAAVSQLAEMEKDYSRNGYGALAALNQAGLLAKAGKIEEAINAYEKVAAHSASNQHLRDLALMNAAYLAGPDPGKVAGILARLAKDSFFRPAAFELQGILAQREGKKAEALAFFEQGLSLMPDGDLAARLNRRIQMLPGTAEAAPPPALAPDAAVPATAATAPDGAAVPATAPEAAAPAPDAPGGQ